MEFDRSPPPSQLPGLIATKDPNLNLGETASTNPYVVFNTVSPNNGKRLEERRRCGRLWSTHMNRDQHHPGPRRPEVNPPLTHVLPPGIVGSQDLDLYPYDVDKAKQLLADAGYSERPHPEVPLPQRVRGQHERPSRPSSRTCPRPGSRSTGVPSPERGLLHQVPAGADRRAAAGCGTSRWRAGARTGTATRRCRSSARCSPASRRSRPIGSNFGFYNDPATNKLIDQAAAAPDESDGRVPVGEGRRAGDEGRSVLPDHHRRSTRTTTPRRCNNAIYIPAIQNFDPTNVWLSKDMQGG